MEKMTKLSEVIMDESYSKDYIKTFSKRMLKTQLFMGTFQEKRYVEPLNSYRDVVKVASDEKEFIENIWAVRKKLRQEFSGPWIGITGPDIIGAPVGYNLWVILPIEVFGTYWFKVKTVEFLQNEVRVKLDVVRPVRSEKSTSDISDADSQNFDIKKFSNIVKSNISNIVKTYMTLTNIKGTVIFLILLTGTIITGGVNIVKYLMEYLLKLMNETSSFVKVCTPIIISCIELIRKTIWGLFSLIVALVHGKPAVPPPVYMPYGDPNHMLQYRNPGGRYSYNTRPPLTYRSSVRIQPLEDE